MKDRDAVIRHSVAAVDNHAHDVRRALELVLRGDPSGERALRDALVAQSAGFESAHDGATYAARVSSSRAALEAWDNG